MNTIDVKEQVRQAIRTEWPAFAAAHPRLAAVLDETLVLEEAHASLADDPEFQQAMAQAAAAGLVAESLQELVTRFIQRWMRRLV